ncbi:D-aminoacylase [Abditibacteriota bacterium]|nr:D-aminoacylase [Abditibacteriota bacterium]
MHTPNSSWRLAVRLPENEITGGSLLTQRALPFLIPLLVVAIGSNWRDPALGQSTVATIPVSMPLLIKGGTLIDGTGTHRRKADIRVENGVIREIGHLKPTAAERVINAKGLIVAPGFIDTHSHADGGLMETPDAESQIRQGITTAIVGQDGGSHLPLAKYFEDVQAKHVALNIASFVGHGTVRGVVMGEDYKRPATAEETAKMAALVDQEMQAGALGLSSGLEYDPGLYSTTEEVIACAKAASKHGGLYISHVRDEENEALTSFRELIRIADEAHLPAQISHIKLGSSNVWGKADETLRLMGDADRRGLDITADVYPYTYWRSTIIVITPTRDWTDRGAWQKGLDEIGGPANVLLSTYTPDLVWQGKTLAQISQMTGRDAVTTIQEIVKNTHGEGATGKEGVVVTAMQENDLRRFIAAPRIMFCTDGGLGGSHPRAAGTYPRILGRYVRQWHVLTLENAIRKMTSLPAGRMGFADRGTLKPGMKADIVLFDANKVIDTATTASPMAQPIGLPCVIVNGVPVLDGGKMTGQRPGMVLRRTEAPLKQE